MAENRWVHTCAMFRLVASMLLALAGCCRSTPPALPTAQPMDAATVEENNRGVALMSRYAYGEALEAFSALAQAHPELAEVQVNLAIARLNRQQEGDTAAAIDLLQGVLQKQPDHPRANFCTGLLLLYQGQPQTALAHLQAAFDADPHDAFTAYWIGQCHAEQQQFEDALAWYRRSMEFDGYLRSGYYGALTALRQLGRGDEAQNMLADYERLKNNPLAQLAEFKYSRMGAKADAISIDQPLPEKPTRPPGPLFADARPLDIAGANSAVWADAREVATSPSITVCDINGDEQLDLFLASALAKEELHNAVLLQDGGKFRLDREHPLARVADVNAALWGDYDNDGRTDVYLCRRGENQLWRQSKLGRFEDVTQAAGAAAGKLNTVDGAMVDADHDGDLDLLLIHSDGPTELLSNNLDGTFRPLAEEVGIAGDGRPAVGLALADLDDDRDVDLVILKRAPPHDVFINDRAWQYHPGIGFDALRQAPADSIIAADIEPDGKIDLITHSGGEISQWSRANDGAWTRSRLVELDDSPTPFHPQLAVADIDGDGKLDLLHSSENGWGALVRDDDKNTWNNIFISGDPSNIATAPFSKDQGLSVIGLRHGQPPLVWSPGQGRFRFATLAIQGRQDAADQLRSNASGIGATGAIRIDSRWTALSTLRSQSGPGQSLTPIAVGLAGHDAIDFVRLLWPDGVLQTEMTLGAEPHVITETQRQLSSCPVLFCWDGERFSFVTDLLGVGGLGFAIGRKEYAPATPHENILLPVNSLAARDGRYVLKLTEPMEEACYLDQVQLIAYDLPPDWRMVLDERMNIAGPPATGDALFFQHEALPTHAVNTRGDDVTEQVVSADRAAASPGKRDSRFLGRTQTHSLTLSFDESLAAMKNPVLIADGWIEYPYSQTMFAAWQADATYDAPTVEAFGGDGQWKVIHEQVGYPAGMPRTMSVPLVNLPSDCRQLRITTNQEIYWDRLAVAESQPCPQVVRRELPLVVARVGLCGFPRWLVGPQRVPQFDYQDRLPLWDTRHQSGYYTQFGDALALVEARDSAVAIFGPGEEIHLEFTALNSAPENGWTRTFVLESTGWCKDMDLYTQHGETLAPLPTHSDLSPQQQRERNWLHEKFNTRYRSGH